MGHVEELQQANKNLWEWIGQQQQQPAQGEEAAQEEPPTASSHVPLTEPDAATAAAVARYRHRHHPGGPARDGMEALMGFREDQQEIQGIMGEAAQALGPGYAPTVKAVEQTLIATCLQHRATGFVAAAQQQMVATAQQLPLPLPASSYSGAANPTRGLPLALPHSTTPSASVPVSVM